MRKTIKGKLTLNVICIVAVSIILTTAGIVILAGRNLIQKQTEALQLNADKYAEEINTWIEAEKLLRSEERRVGKDRRKVYPVSCGYLCVGAGRNS